MVKPQCALCETIRLNLERTLGVTNYELLDPYNNEKDRAKCFLHNLHAGHLAVYNGTSVVKIDMFKNVHDVNRMKHFLRGAGYEY